MTTIDYTPFLQAGVNVAALILPVALPAIATWFVYEFRKRTHVSISENMAYAVETAARTGAGILKNMLQQGKLNKHDITITNPTVAAIAEEVTSQMPGIMASLNITPQVVTNKIVAAVAHEFPMPETGMGHTVSTPNATYTILPKTAGVSA